MRGGLGTFIMGLVSLQGIPETPTTTTSLSHHIGDGEQVAICKARREPSPETNHVGTLILDFLTLEL